MINKILILLKAVLFCLLFSGCKTTSLNMLKGTVDNKNTEEDEVKFTEANVAAIKAILENNNLLNKPTVALFWSLKNKEISIAKWLILSGSSNVNVTDDSGMTPLHIIACLAYDDPTSAAFAEWLIVRGADTNAIDNVGRTPLHIAAFCGSTLIVNLLINKEANVNVKDFIGMTPLSIAFSLDRSLIAELLIGAGADVNVKARRLWGY